MIFCFNDFVSFRARCRIHRREKMPITRGYAATKEVQLISSHGTVPIGLTQRVEKRTRTTGDAHANRVVPISMAIDIGVSVLKTLIAWKRQKRIGMRVYEGLCRLLGGGMGVGQRETSRLTGMNDPPRRTLYRPSISRHSTGD